MNYKKFLFSKVLYIMIGIMIAIAFSANAILFNVETGDTLSALDYNLLIDEVNNLRDEVNNLRADLTSSPAYTDADVKSYIKNNCYVCFVWGDWGVKWQYGDCKMFGGDWASIYTSGEVDGNDVFGIRADCY